MLSRDRKEQSESVVGHLGEQCFSRGNSRRKGEAGVGLVCLRDSEETGAAGTV